MLANGADAMSRRWSRLVGFSALLVLTMQPASAPAAADVPTSFGRPATILGTEGDDTLIGTAGPDVIVGLGGSDFVRPGPGDDGI